jgi:beta-N-acetylhexosaminidase
MKTLPFFRFSGVVALLFLKACTTQHHYNEPIAHPMQKSAPQSTPAPLREPTFEEKIGQMLMVGFHGTALQDEGVQKVARYIQSGQVGHIIHFGYNIKSPEQTKQLNTYFRSLAPHQALPLLIAVDQEGGRVTRLTAEKGFPTFKSAKQVALTLSPAKAQAYYTSMAKVAHDGGFNLVLGPVVDLEYHPKKGGLLNPAIGKLERAYSADIKLVSAYAQAFIQAHRQYGILTALKHFPGHGLAGSDSHKGLVDITPTFDKLEVAPYYHLMSKNLVDMVMTAHVTHQGYDKTYPATLSPVIIKTLLRDQGYKGVVISDDLFMGAIQSHFNLKTTVIQAIKAGVDILMFSVNEAAMKGVTHRADAYAQNDIISEVIAIIKTAVQQGELTTDHIEASYQRIKQLKSRTSL